MFLVIVWSLIPITLNTIFKRVNNELHLAVIGLIFGFVYGWILIVPGIHLTNIPIKAYLISDIPFEIIMGISNFLTIYWLYNKLYIFLIEKSSI